MTSKSLRQIDTQLSTVQRLFHKSTFTRINTEIVADNLIGALVEPEIVRLAKANGVDLREWGAACRDLNEVRSAIPNLSTRAKKDFFNFCLNQIRIVKSMLST